VLHIKGATIETIDNTKVGALCSYIVVRAVQEGHIRALNITTNESYLRTHSSTVLTWVQGPPNKWKTFVGNIVALIQEETVAVT